MSWLQHTRGETWSVTSMYFSMYTKIWRWAITEGERGSGNLTAPTKCPVHSQVAAGLRVKSELWCGPGVTLSNSSLPLWIWPIFRPKECWLILQLPTLAVGCKDLTPSPQTDTSLALTAFPRTLQVWKEWHSWGSFRRQLRLMSWLSKSSRKGRKWLWLEASFSPGSW